MMEESTQDKYFVGDEWLFYKIYTGSKTSDIILCEIIKPLTEELILKKIIKKWFFIRYSDPEYHLRIRFLVVDKSNLFELIYRLNAELKKFIENDLIWKTQIDTYTREIYRYNLLPMEFSENMFYHDSKMIVSLLDLIGGQQGEEIRWKFSLLAIDSFLNCFKLSDLDKLNVLDKLNESYSLEFGRDKNLNNQLLNRYRDKRKEIFNFFKLKRDDVEYGELIFILDKKSDEIIKIINPYLAEIKVKPEFHNFLSSHIHMTMNRVFKSRNRFHELVCYDFLNRYYLMLKNIK